MEKDISYNNLINVAEKNQKYLNGEADVNGSETIDMAWSAIKLLRESVPEIKGGFGVGFPFHSISRSGDLIVNPEFKNYSSKFIQKVKYEKSMGNVAWKCIQCQKNNEYHPTQCKDCLETSVKPRDVMKVMPDIDLFIIADDISTEVLDNIQNVAKQHSFHQSDYNSLETLERIEQVFNTFDQHDKKNYLPADMHVISKKDFCAALDKIGSGNLESNVDIYSMYYSWTLDHNFDLAFDFIFSGTFNPEICDSDIMMSVDKARRGLVTNLSERDILDVITTKSERADVLLSHNPTKDIFLDKIRSWKELNNDRFAYSY